MCGLHFGTEIAPVELMNTAIEGKARTYKRLPTIGNRFKTRSGSLDNAQIQNFTEGA